MKGPGEEKEEKQEIKLTFLAFKNGEINEIFFALSRGRIQTILLSARAVRYMYMYDAENTEAPGVGASDWSLHTYHVGCSVSAERNTRTLQALARSQEGKGFSVDRRREWDALKEAIGRLGREK